MWFSRPTRTNQINRRPRIPDPTKTFLSSQNFPKTRIKPILLTYGLFHPGLKWLHYSRHRARTVWFTCVSFWKRHSVASNKHHETIGKLLGSRGMGLATEDMSTKHVTTISTLSPTDAFEPACRVLTFGQKILSTPKPFPLARAEKFLVFCTCFLWSDETAPKLTC
jgi:hypothetical protein